MWMCSVALFVSFWDEVFTVPCPIFLPMPMIPYYKQTIDRIQFYNTAVVKTERSVARPCDSWKRHFYAFYEVYTALLINESWTIPSAVNTNGLMQPCRTTEKTLVYGKSWRTNQYSEERVWITNILCRHYKQSVIRTRPVIQFTILAKGVWLLRTGTSSKPKTRTGGTDNTRCSVNFCTQVCIDQTHQVIRRARIYICELFAIKGSFNVNIQYAMVVWCVISM